MQIESISKCIKPMINKKNINPLLMHKWINNVFMLITVLPKQLLWATEINKSKNEMKSS